MKLMKIIKTAVCFTAATAMCLNLTACGGSSKTAAVSENTKQESALQNDDSGTMAKEAVEQDTTEKTSEAKSLWSKEEQEEEAKYLEELFEPDLVFQGMDQTLADSYGEPLKDYYDFLGRITEDGYGYVLAFRKDNGNPLEDLELYGIDDYIEASSQDPETQEEIITYSFRKLTDICQGDGNDILYLQPMDMEEPEELKEAFVFGYCRGEDGKKHFNDVIERGVRFTPSDTGAYLAVYKYEMGQAYEEFIPLTEKEEQAILESDALIEPSLYGKNGLQFYVSQKTYEQMDMEEGPITQEALAIAEERGKFQIVEPSEIHDLTKARLLLLNDASGKSLEDGIDITLTDSVFLSELEAVISSAQPLSAGDCPYYGRMFLTRKDGETFEIDLAIDGCDGFVIGSYGFYSLGTEGMEAIWRMFPEAKPYIGESGMDSQ